MNEDRELLEAAARANWAQEVADDEIGLRYSEPDNGILYLHADNQDHEGNDRELRWNPLEENHDALALAVKLNISITRPTKGDSPEHFGTWADSSDQLFGVKELDGDDPYAATRRAIVRCAAFIHPKEDGHE